ncbi:MAG: AbrB/MazE/SpoVT family DNA-binding domain-containing protein [bacterium]
MEQTVRQVTTIGNSLGVTLPKEMAEAYGLQKGSLVTVRPVESGLLLEPAKVVSALSPEGSAAVTKIVRRYRNALDAMAREDRTSEKR